MLSMHVIPELQTNHVVGFSRCCRNCWTIQDSSVIRRLPRGLNIHVITCTKQNTVHKKVGTPYIQYSAILNLTGNPFLPTNLAMYMDIIIIFPVKCSTNRPILKYADSNTSPRHGTKIKELASLYLKSLCFLSPKPQGTMLEKDLY